VAQLVAPSLGTLLRRISPPAAPPPLVGARLATHLRLQAELQQRPSLLSRAGGVAFAVAGSAAAAGAGAVVLTVDALDAVLGVTALGGALFGWLPGLGLPSRAVTVAHVGVGAVKGLPKLFTSSTLANVVFFGALAVQRLFYREQAYDARPWVLQLLAAAIVAAVGAVHVLVLWHVAPDPRGTEFERVVDWAAFAGYLVVLPLWVGAGAARVMVYPHLHGRVAVVGDGRGVAEPTPSVLKL
jgi:hypothetical protein